MYETGSDYVRHEPLPEGERYSSYLLAKSKLSMATWEFHTYQFHRRGYRRWKAPINIEEISKPNYLFDLLFTGWFTIVHKRRAERDTVENLYTAQRT